MTTKIKNTENKNIFSQAWNEFLFAREFEYETPLTPDEVMQHLNQLEGDSYFSRWHMSTLDHDVDYEPAGDKEGTFRIKLEPRKDKWWKDDSTLQETRGTLTVDADTGMTAVKGHTRFSVQFYGLMLLIIASNVMTSSVVGIWWMLFWTGFTLLLWYSLYTERNKLTDRI
ncbi:MAG: hypothetical protein AAFQ07_19480 [Chloroflexota bacterium]